MTHPGDPEAGRIGTWSDVSPKLSEVLGYRPTARLRHLVCIDPGDWLVREVYAHFGLAIYHAAVLEHGIVNPATTHREKR